MASSDQLKHVTEKIPFVVAVISLLMIFVLGKEGSCFAQQSDTITYTYDSLNRLTKVVYSSGATIIYTYDAAGNRISIQITGGSDTTGFSLNSVTPQAGRASGGQQIKLSGSFDGLATVLIGGAAATWNYSNGTSEITVTTPQHAAGAVNIDLIPSAGVAVSKTNAFAYLPTTFTDDTLVVGVTTAKAQHIIELRQAIDALRVVAGLSPAPWTDAALVPQSTIIRAVHIQELRSYLEEAAGRLGYTPQSYTDSSLTSGFLIKRVHIEELRQRIRTIAG